MKRKAVMSILVATMVLALSACGGQEGSGNTSGTNAGNTAQSQEETSQKEDVKDEKQEEKKDTKVEVSMEGLQSAEVAPASDFEVFGAEGGVVIVEYLGDAEVLVLPEEIDGQKVVGIGGNVFGKDSTVKAIKLSDTIESIDNSFLGNEGLKYVICGSSLKKIGEYGFGNCISLEEIQLNEGLEVLDSWSFYGCKS